MDIPVIGLAGLAVVDREQMMEVDRVMIDELGITLLQMMENAGRNLADLSIRRFQPERVVVVAGSGGNGGGGMAAARHLANRSRSVEVVCISEPRGEGPSRQRDILHRMGIAVHRELPAMESADLIVDAMIGYSLVGAPRGSAAAAIAHLDRLAIPVLSLDTPSGVDVSTGATAGSHVSAVATMTLAAPKIGLMGHPAVGEHYLADISVPAATYRAFGMQMGDVFRHATLVRIAD